MAVISLCTPQAGEGSSSTPRHPAGNGRTHKDSGLHEAAQPRRGPLSPGHPRGAATVRAEAWPAALSRSPARGLSQWLHWSEGGSLSSNVELMAVAFQVCCEAKM